MEAYLINPISPMRSAGRKRRIHKMKLRRSKKGRFLPRKGHKRVSRRRSNPVRKHRRHVRRHYRRNPMSLGGLKMPGLPSMGEAQKALMAVALIWGAAWASRWVSDQASAYIPGTQVGIPRTLVGLGGAILVVWAGRQFIKDAGLRTVLLGAASFPVAMDLVYQFAPAQLGGAVATAPKLALDAQLDAELSAESEQGLY